MLLKLTFTIQDTITPALTPQLSPWDPEPAAGPRFSRQNGKTGLVVIPPLNCRLGPLQSNLEGANYGAVMVNEFWLFIWGFGRSFGVWYLVCFVVDDSMAGWFCGWLGGNASELLAGYLGVWFASRQKHPRHNSYKMHWKFTQLTSFLCQQQTTKWLLQFFFVCLRCFFFSAQLGNVCQQQCFPLAVWCCSLVFFFEMNDAKLWFNIWFGSKSEILLLLLFTTFLLL